MCVCILRQTLRIYVYSYYIHLIFGLVSVINSPEWQNIRCIEVPQATQDYTIPESFLKFRGGWQFILNTCFYPSE